MEKEKLNNGIMNGKRGIVMGVANDRSIAWGIAEAVAKQGAEVAFNLATELEFDVRIIPLAEGQDPGSLTQNEVDLKIAKYYV